MQGGADLARSPCVAMREQALQRLDDLHKQQDEDDEQDKADSAAAVVSETRSHAIAAKAEHQNQDEQKNKHLCFSPFGEVSPDEGCDADFVVNV